MLHSIRSSKAPSLLSKVVARELTFSEIAEVGGASSAARNLANTQMGTNCTLSVTYDCEGWDGIDN